MDGRVDITGLYTALDTRRQARGLSWRQLAKEADVSPSLLSRMANGQRPDIDGFAALIQWLGVEAEAFMVSDSADPPDPPTDDLLTEVNLLLRARKDLTDTDRRYLQDVVEATLKHVRAVKENG